MPFYRYFLIDDYLNVIGTNDGDLAVRLFESGEYEVIDAKRGVTWDEGESAVYIERTIHDAADKDDNFDPVEAEGDDE